MTRLRPALILRLAWRDLAHAWAGTAFLAVAVTAALLPLLLLYGLKYGIVTNMIDSLRTDPRIREIAVVKEISPGLTADWFTTMRADVRVDFLIAHTLHLASSISVTGPKSRNFLEGRLVPTAVGDPLLPGAQVPQGMSQVAITDRVAKKTGAAIGDVLDVMVERNVADKSERVRHVLTVVAILPGGLLERDDLLVDGAFEQAVERWRQGYGVGDLGWLPAPGRTEPVAADRSFPGFRLYARDVRDVPALRDLLVAQGFDIRTKGEQIERTLLIESGLSWIFGVVAVMSGAGFLVTLALQLLASVNEKARELSVLRLLGMGRLELALVPAVQGALIAAGGGALAVAVALIAQPQVNRLLQGLAGLSGNVSQITPAQAALGLAATLSVGLLAGGLAGYKAARLEPSVGLRKD